jgi:hypothetical protein
MNAKQGLTPVEYSLVKMENSDQNNSVKNPFAPDQNAIEHQNTFPDGSNLAKNED